MRGHGHSWKWVVVLRNGQLGNQLFQYKGCLSYFGEGSKLITVNMEDLIRFCGVDIINIDIKGKAFVVARTLVKALARIRILSSCIEYQDEGQHKLIEKQGILPWVIVVLDSYFQHKSLIDNFDSPPVLRKEIREKAWEWLHANGAIGHSGCKDLAFVHVRLRDFQSWPSKEYPALLDPIWYKKATKALERDKDVRLILLSDDIDTARELVDIKGALVSTGSIELDMGIMSWCSHGVLSPSSFAWWGAYFARNYGININNRFICKKFWGGHRMGRRFPAGFKTKWIEEME